MKNNITHTEQAGTISWWAGIWKTELRVMEANFMLSLDGQTVVARTMRGRNHWNLCNIADVESFTTK
jgi:hypothetical protein